MEDKKITEQESLMLITNMISQTKNHLNVGQFNTFLIWGYVCASVSLLVYATVLLTQIQAFALLYFLIPVLGCLFTVLTRKKNAEQKGMVKSYTTDIIDRVWNMIGYTFILAGVIIGLAYLIDHGANFALFWLIGFIMPSFGCTVTGNVINEKCLYLGGMFGLACSFAMTYCLMNGGHISINWCLIFAACYVIMMIIPGHYLNYKARKQNHKN